MPRGGLRAAPFEGLSALSARLGWGPLAIRALRWLARAFWTLFPGLQKGSSGQGTCSKPWESHPDRRVYGGADGEGRLLIVYTDPDSFQVDLAQLAGQSGYFRALSQSGMQEALGGPLRLDHVRSGAFRAILEWVFVGHFNLTEAELLPAVQAASYLMLPGFLSQCWRVLRPTLSPQNCWSYLEFAEAVGCPELNSVVCGYLSAHLLELAAPLASRLPPSLKEELAQRRMQGPPRLCVLRKENISVPPREELEALRGFYCRPLPPRDGDWRRVSTLPFQADKWSFSTAQTLNYLFIMGGYRERRGARGFTFRMAAFCYNPLTDSWRPITAPKKRRRHFSTAVVGQHIYAIGGWYLDSLLAPDSSTCLYTAVERYDPWSDQWTSVSSLPMADFSFTVSLSHDLPLCTADADCIYALGRVQRTGEKLLMRYNVAADTWQELMPTLTQADADLPGLYFLGGAEQLYVVGGNTENNVVTSFSLSSRQWGPMHALPKRSLAGQGLAVDGILFMASPDLGAVLALDLEGLDDSLLPPPPFPLYYEAFFLLHFPPDTEAEDAQGW